MDNHRETYKDEAYELLSELETSLLELEEKPDDVDLISRIFRALHTIKGSGAMFGFDDIAAFTHEVETVFDLVRDGKIAVTKELINLALSARDQIKLMLDASESGEVTNGLKMEQLIQSVRAVAAKSKKLAEKRPSESFLWGKPHQPDFEDIQKIPPYQSKEADVQSPEAGTITYHIRFCPAVDIFTNGTNPILLLNELREFGESSIIAKTNAIPILGQYDPEACYTCWDIILKTDKSINEIKDVFIFVEEHSELSIEAASQERSSGEEDILEKEDFPVEDDEVLSEEIQSDMPEQEQLKIVRRKHRESAAISSIRVPAEKLDSLVNLVGELVTVQARLSRKSSFQQDPEFHAIAEEVERLTGELRDKTMSIRMLPIGTTFAMFRRQVRDLSMDLGKDVNLKTEGGDTELDKTVIDQLNDPLMHIIRNCIDHGIESPGTREALGKPREGTIHLSAEHSGASVLIRISDDGAGFDAEALHRSAVNKGLIAHDVVLSETEIFQLAFISGISTSKKVTDISGRGVGMDVVKRNIEALHGSVVIESKKATGTTVTMKLPLTLAIIDGLLIKIGEDYFVLPLAVVEECVELKKEEAHMAKGRNMMNLRGEIVPYLSMREFFKIEGKAPAIEQIVIVEAKGTRIGLEVDHVKGQHQTVIKPLGKAYREIDWISGATIMGDGTVALIVDVNQLVRSVENLMKVQ